MWKDKDKRKCRCYTTYRICILFVLQEVSSKQKFLNLLRINKIFWLENYDCFQNSSFLNSEFNFNHFGKSSLDHKRAAVSITFYALMYLLESYPLRGYSLGLGAPGTNSVGASGAINVIQR